MADLAGPDRLEERLGEADFVIVTAPEMPDTLGMFNATRFSRIKRGAYFIGSWSEKHENAAKYAARPASSARPIPSMPRAFATDWRALARC